MAESPDRLLRKALQERLNTSNVAEAIRRFGWQDYESTVRSHHNGTRKPGKLWATRYAKAYGISRNKLLQLDVDNSAVSDIPVVGKAELGAWYDIDIEMKSLDLRGPPIQVPRSVGKEMRKAVEVADASVDRVIRKGDFAIYEPVSDKDLDDLVGGYVYVSRRRGSLEERTIRKVSRKGEKLELITDSSDTRYTGTITYPSSRPDETIKILGRVVAHYGPL